MSRFLACAAVATALLAPTRARADFWHGTIRCPIIPGLNTVPLVGDFFLTIDGTTVRYDRPVHLADSAAVSGISEYGSGTLSGAEISLQGGARGQGYDYASTYRGRLDGNRIHLTGEQVWNASALHEPFHRPCAIDLAR